MRVLIAALALSLGLAGPAAAQVAITDGWVRATPAGVPTAAAYLTLTNRGRAPDRLLSARTSAAASAGVHTMSMTGGIMRMRPVEGGLPLPPGGAVTLSPGGDHLMLMGLKRPLPPGARLSLTLRFERAGVVKLSLPVRAAPPPG